MAERSRFSPSYSLCHTWKRSRRSLYSSLVPRPSRAGSRPEANESVMLGCNSHSHSFTASFKVTRPTLISTTSAIASLEFFLVSSLPDLFSNISGPSRVESNRRPHNEIVEEYRLCVVDLRMVRLRSSRDGENNAAARSDNRLERRATQRRDRMLDACEERGAIGCLT